MYKFHHHLCHFHKFFLAKHNSVFVVNRKKTTAVYSLSYIGRDDIIDSVKYAGSTEAAAPPPFRPSEPALCGSCPLVTPY